MTVNIIKGFYDFCMGDLFTAYFGPKSPSAGNTYILKLWRRVTGL
jgi:hypothetical protein